jgi:hypothetical protein
MAKKDGIAAVLKEYKDPVPLEKMTLKDFFAAFACIGAVSLGDPEQTAKQAYAVAEAMLDERDR